MNPIKKEKTVDTKFIKNQIRIQQADWYLGAT